MKSTQRISVLVIETNLTLREGFKSFCKAFDDVAIEAIVPTAHLALEKFSSHPVDVILLDQAVVDMPPMQFTRQILEKNPETGIIITVPEDDPKAAESAVGVLAAGAFDYILKPAPHTKDAFEILQRRILPKIRTCSIRKYSRQAQLTNIHQMPQTASPTTEAAINKLAAGGAAAHTPAGKQYEAILIGVSTGGPEALLKIMPQFPADFLPPVIIVLHMPRLFTGPLAETLTRESKIKVREAVDKMELAPGCAYLAQGGLHLELTRGTRNMLVARQTEAPPENGCRPAVDVLFRTAAPLVRNKSITVVLTGMGVDGTKGAEQLKKEGSFVIAQDEATSVVWGMPGSIVRAGLADAVLPLDAIVPEIVKRVTIK